MQLILLIVGFIAVEVPQHFSGQETIGTICLWAFAIITLIQVLRFLVIGAFATSDVRRSSRRSKRYRRGF